MTSPPAPATPAALREPLCRWYAKHRRDLPWRRTCDPYAVWISETMLQQTRVEAVLDAYRDFLARFPDVPSLAGASPAEVEAAWSGLGYYRRARNLHAAARILVAAHAGALPADRDRLLALPGVGRYTAGAILSIAFGRSEPLVDGNVARVLCRLFALDEPLASGALERRLWSLAAALVPPAGARGPVRPGAWNQGLMELGALVCLPREPRCADCPLAARCRARREGREAVLPVRRPRRNGVDVFLEILVVRRGNAVLVVRRPAAGRMAGLWELPTRELAPPGAPPLLWPAAHARPGLTAGEELGRLSHAITCHRIRAVVRSGRLVGPAGDARWLAPAAAADLGLTGMARKVLARWGGRGSINPPAGAG
ncbi:MAG: A/G-specific adenine glycosylase [Planctomycetota bacterium]